MTGIRTLICGTINRALITLVPTGNSFRGPRDGERAKERGATPFVQIVKLTEGKEPGAGLSICWEWFSRRIAFTRQAV